MGSQTQTAVCTFLLSQGCVFITVVYCWSIYLFGCNHHFVTTMTLRSDCEAAAAECLFTNLTAKD